MRTHYFTSSLLLLTSFFGRSLSIVTRECKSCPSATILRAPAYGIDLSTDYLAVAVQHVNGTLEPIAHLNATSEYRNMMLTILSEADIHPYGHRSMEEKPEPVTDSPPNKSRVEILIQEIRNLISAISPNQPSPIEYYFLSVPMYFTHLEEGIVLQALKALKMPMPISTITADSSAFLSLTRAKCDHFVACAPVDKEKHILLFFEYSRSTMSASFMNFWGGWFLTPHAYFADASLGAEHLEENGEEHWTKITKRIDDLIHDYEHKLFEGPSDSRRFTIGSLKLILMGELGSNPGFRKAVRDALSKHYEADDFKLERYQEEKILDPPFLAALGVAKEAKDRIDKRGIMAGCNSEKEACTNLREMVIRQALEKKGYKDYQRWRDEL